MKRLLLITVLTAGCQEFTIAKDPPDVTVPVDSDDGAGICGFTWAPRTVDTLPECGNYEVGGFQPWVEWNGVRGKNSTALPVVADLDGDRMPEILVNVTGLLPGDKGELWALHGDGSGVLWRNTTANLGFGTAVAVGDIDHDGYPEIVGVRAKGGQLPTAQNISYTVVAWDHEGNELWESREYGKINFDYATGIILSDMDHDGEVEIVAGRVILHADGTERGKGEHGHGSYGIALGISEASLPAVADLDLDGVEEVIVGDAYYDPDGNTIWHDARRNDAMIAVANLDDDPEGEWVAITGNSYRAHDTDGSLLWGPIEIPTANIVSPAAIADIDADGYPEIVVAGGDELRAVNHDGSTLWSRSVQDESGATGASIFDFDGDGVQEVVYIDEVAVYAFNGTDGFEKFRSDEHASNTMMDYPVIADVDADGEAEIVVAHVGYGFAITVYGQADGRWAPTRRVWNQHAYSRDNVADDLDIPQTAVQGFTTHNTWHSATDASLLDQDDRYELQGVIQEVCTVQCEQGTVYVAAQLVNKSPTTPVPAGVPVTLYMVRAGGLPILLETVTTTQETPPASTGEQLVFSAPSELIGQAPMLRLVVDDDGTATPNGHFTECVENDNTFEITGPFCP
ncbi:MAG: VCBS repeat-containing protein [Alphaproteobacteria bacterium]|nr:VCBS repeat-containing protein [Alphaproteobacteria bacterium]